ncbi:universal stress protein [Paucibacter sp. TC2R-5]|uniref:universal stress protein n=1 Tax=Paucibacter sp. TC2R-5 TaxID=2893555 RepID=UPI0021E500D2|nr:universal stress protein [Paucibacter sp. TC2R-5]MCV2357557.1 universal stress protein [Paucibacter sp. TC2R-5]
MAASSKIKSMVVHVNDKPRSAQVVALAQRFAQALGAHLAAVHAVAPSNTGAYLSPEAASLALDLHEGEDQRRVQRAAELVKAAGADISFRSEMGDSAEAMVQIARNCDLLVMSQQDPQVPDGSADGLIGRLLISGGCPILFVPYVNDTPLARCGERVLVAWTDKRESARALRDALPFLQAAKHIELVRFSESAELGPEPLLRPQAYLRLHGIECTLKVLHQREPSLGERLMSSFMPDASVAEALLSHAADSDSDLIVMGGYGQTRLWELVLGGVTRSMLHSMTVPVLMSH